MTTEADDFYIAEPYMDEVLSQAQAADTMFGAVLVRGGVLRDASLAHCRTLAGQKG